MKDGTGSEGRVGISLMLNPESLMAMPQVIL